MMLPEKSVFLGKAYDKFQPILSNSELLKPGIEAVTIDYSSSDELLHELTLSGDHWDAPHVQISSEPDGESNRNQRINKNNLSSPWYFRGQRDADWDLSPKIWRDDEHTLKELRRYSSQMLIDRATASSKDLFTLEADILRRYEITLERSGIHMPHLTRTEKERRSGGFYEILSGDYPYETKDEAEEIGNNQTPAIAQHHGVPTRLLDLTTRPFLAAYMACRDFYSSEDNLAQLNSEEKKIALWSFSWESLNNPLLQLHTSPNEIKESGLAKAINKGRFIVEFPSASVDSRILAQGGLFTYPNLAKSFYNTFKQLPSLESYLINGTLYSVLDDCLKPSSTNLQQSYYNLLSTKPSEFFDALASSDNIKNFALPYFRKYTLPYSEVNKLMECLDAMGIDETTAFPGIEQVSTALTHRTLRSRAMGLSEGYNMIPKKIQTISLPDDLVAIAKKTNNQT